MPAMNRPSTKRLLQVGLGLALLAGLFVVVDLGQTFEVLRRANLWWVLAGFAMTVVSRALMAFKWNLLLRAGGVSLPYLEVFRIYYISGFLGLFLPATVGGDIVRAVFVKREDNTYSDIISSIIVERLLGLLIIALAAVMGSAALVHALLAAELPAIRLLLLSAGLVLISTLLVGISFSQGFRALVTRAAESFAAQSRIGRVSRKLESYFHAYWNYRYHKLVLGVFGLLTALEIGLVVLWSYCVGLALEINLDFIWYLMIIPVTTLVVRLPISFAGIGVYEGMFVFFMTVVGISQDVGLAFGLLTHALEILGLLPGGLIYAFAPEYRRRRGAVIAETSPVNQEGTRKS